MIYGKTVNVERNVFHPAGDVSERLIIEFVKSSDKPIFSVAVTDCYGNERYWEFNMSCPSDYERVKQKVLEIAFMRDTATELMNALDKRLAHRFDDIFLDGEKILVDDCWEYGL